jgi:hypothetical protein
MKKLAVLMTIPALAMFMVPALASANWYYWWGIQGTWEMSASGSCLHSSEPYYQNPDRNNWWTAPPGSEVYAGVTVSNGTWTFKAHGAGTYSQRIYATILPGGADSMNGIPVPLEVRVLPPLSVAQPTPVEFTYEITPSGDITVTETVSGIKLFGHISKDMNTMTLLSANNVQKFGANFQYTICNTARTLIKVPEMYYPTGLR